MSSIRKGPRKVTRSPLENGEQTVNMKAVRTTSTKSTKIDIAPVKNPRMAKKTMSRAPASSSSTVNHSKQVASRSTQTPLAIFQTRQKKLIDLCTICRDANTFWGAVDQAILDYMSSAPVNLLYESMCSFTDTIFAAASSRGNEFASGRNYVTLCKHLSYWSQKSKDFQRTIALFDRIISVTRSTDGQLSDSDCIAASVSFASAVIAIESNCKLDVNSLLSDLENLSALITLAKSENVESLVKNYDTLRRCVVKMVDNPNTRKDVFVNILQSCIALTQEFVNNDALFNSPYAYSLLIGSIDSLTVLYQVACDPIALTIDDKANDYLLIMKTFARKLQDEKTYKIVASCFYNAGGVYCKCGKYIWAMGWMQKSCEFLLAAIEKMIQHTAIDSPDVEALTLTLVKRYELLAGFARQANEPAKGQDALGRALAAYPPSGLGNLAVCFRTGTVSAAADKFDILNKIIVALTKIAINDLCVELPIIAAPSDKPEIEVGFKELQLLALDNMPESSEARLAKASVTKLLLEFYCSNLYPVRRARTLIHQLRLMFYGYNDDSMQSPEEIGDQVIDLLKTNEMENDSDLRHLRIFYMATCATWLCLWCHRQGSFSGRYRNMALRNWKKLLEPLEKSANEESITKVANCVDAVNQCYVLLKMFSDYLLTSSFLASHLFVEKLLMLISLHLRSDNGAREDAIRHSLDMAWATMHLGYTGKANLHVQQCITLISDSCTSDTSNVRISLANVKLNILRGNMDNASKLLQKILTESMDIGSQPIRESKRKKQPDDIMLLISEVASIRAFLNYTLGHLGDALTDAIQAMRLVNRYAMIAAKAASRLPEKKVVSKFDDNPFSGDNPSDPNNSLVHKKETVLSGLIMTSKQWRSSQYLIESMLLAAKIYYTRGSVREVDYFLNQALMISKAVDAAKTTSKILGVMAEFKCRVGEMKTASTFIESAYSLRKGVVNDRSMVNLLEQRGFYHYRLQEYKDALSSYSQAQRLIEVMTKRDFIQNIETLEIGKLNESPKDRQRKNLEKLSPKPSPRFTSKSLVKQAIVSRKVIAARKKSIEINPFECLELQRDRARIQRLIGMAIASQGQAPCLDVPSTTDGDIHDKIHQDMYTVGLLVQKILLQLAKDPIYGMLIDSAMAIPNVDYALRKGKSFPPSNKSTAFTADLTRAENILINCIRRALHTTMAFDVTELTSTLAFVISIHSALTDSQDPNTSLRTVMNLELLKGVSMKRDLQEAIMNKMKKIDIVDDLRWPAPIGYQEPVSAENHFAYQDKDDDGYQQYWRHLHTFYPLEGMDVLTFQEQYIDSIPCEWTVISITVLPERNDLFISKLTAKEKPVVLRLPLNRQSSRDGDDDPFTHDVAISELTAIITESNNTTQEAKNLQGNEAKLSWWLKRKELDKRLGELLDNIEHCWLGGFKGLMSDPHFDHDDLLASRAKIEKVFLKHACGHNVKKMPSFHVSLEIISCLLNLGTEAEDEELEDLIYHILDLYHFQGIAVAFDEIDFDQIIVEIKEILVSSTTCRRKTPKHNDHMVLLLDKNIQMIPWENLPCLRGRSISRLPTISFLRDRILLAKYRASSKVDIHATWSEYTVNKNSLSYILNPSKDLLNTQAEFETILSGNKNWDGVIGRPPIEAEFTRLVTNKDIFVYFGHGGGEQYVRSHVIKQLPKCAVSILMGCSSGHLKSAGDFDPYGTPLNYMIAGCPALVANLWDVTDKDIDRFSKAMLEKWGLYGETKEEGISIVRAVAESRDKCNLRFLNGAAPVVYGIPVYLQKSNESVNVETLSS